MTLVDILKQIGGSAFIRDRDAYYALTGKSIGTPKDWAIDAIGAAYTYAPLLFGFSYLQSGETSDLILTGITLASRVFGPLACKEFIDNRYDEKYVLKSQLGQLNHEGNSSVGNIQARALFYDLKADAKLLYDDGHYLAAMHRLLDFPGQLTKAIKSA